MFCQSESIHSQALNLIIITSTLINTNLKISIVGCLQHEGEHQSFDKRSISNVWGVHDIEALEPTKCGKYEWPNGPGLYRSVSAYGRVDFRSDKTRDLAAKRITHGYGTKQKQFPSYVRIEFFNVNKPNRYSLCGGTLVARDLVVTAAHCRMSGSNAAWVTAGIVDVNGALSNNTQRTMAYGVCFHKDYIELDKLARHRDFAHDIAVLQLHSKFDFNENVQPACLVDQRPETMGELYIIGMGKIGSDTMSDRLNFLPVEKVNCEFWPDEWNSCYKSKSVGEACQGDSGSALIAIKGGRQYLAGVTSVKGTTNPDPKSDDCKLNRQRPTIYADIFKDRNEIVRMLHYCYEVLPPK